MSARTIEQNEAADMTGESPTFPRIVLRNCIGLALDTNSSYQQAIGKSRQKLAEACASGRLTLGPNEWRLPHAPVPACPDYSRPSGLYQKRRLLEKRSIDNDTTRSNLVEALDIQLSTTLYKNKKCSEAKKYHHWQPLLHTAELVLGTWAANQISSLSFPINSIHQNFLPFVSEVPSILDYPKQSTLSEQHHTTRQATQIVLGADEFGKHDADGYQFPGFCAGCRRSGFTFCYGCERDPEPHYHQDKLARTGGGFTYLKRDQPHCAISRNNPLRWRVMLDLPHVTDSDLQESGMKHKMAVGYEVFAKHKEDSEGIRMSSLPFLVRQNSHLGPSTTPASDAFSPAEVQEEAQTEVEDEEKESQDSGRELTDEESMDFLKIDATVEVPFVHLAHGESEEILTVDDDSIPSTVHTKEKLYKAPEAFQLKKRQHKLTEASSPFSTDRHLNIPKYKEFEIHQSDKKLTEFEEFAGGDPNWQAPEAFKLHERVHSDDTTVPAHPSVGFPVVHHPQPPIEQSKPASVPTSSAQEEEDARKSSSKMKVKRPKEHSQKQKQKPYVEKRSEITAAYVESPLHSVSPVPAVMSQLTTEQVSAKQSSASGSVHSDSIITADITVTEMPLQEPPETDSHKTETGVSKSSVSEPVIGPRPPKHQRKREDERTVKPKRVRAKEPSKKERRQDSVRYVISKSDVITTPPSELQQETEQSEKIPDEISVTPEATFRPFVIKEHTLPLLSTTMHVEHPPLPTASPPSLPNMVDFIEPVKPVRELSTTYTEVPPPMMEPPKQRKPPPALKPKARRRVRGPPVHRTAGAPVQVAEVKNISDPLDFLAKYCIIHPERLPHYVRVFSKAVSEQMYRYTDVPHPDGQQLDDDNGQETSDTVAKDIDGVTHDDVEAVKTILTDIEKERLHNFTVINATLKPYYSVMGLNEGDQTLSKMNFILDSLMDKYEALQEKLDSVTAIQVQLLASLAKKHFPRIGDLSYKQAKSKKKKEKTKSTGVKEVTADMAVNVATDTLSEQKRNTTDLDIVRRLDDKQLKFLNNCSLDLSRLRLEQRRLQEKLKDVDDRIESLEDEKGLVQLYARDEFQRLETVDSKPEHFVRQQSALYRTVHPLVNVEINVSDMEEALQEINNHLITKKKKVPTATLR